MRGKPRLSAGETPEATGEPAILLNNISYKPANTLATSTIGHVRIPAPHRSQSCERSRAKQVISSTSWSERAAGFDKTAGSEELQKVSSSGSVHLYDWTLTMRRTVYQKHQIRERRLALITARNASRASPKGRIDELR